MNHHASTVVDALSGEVVLRVLVSLLDNRAPRPALRTVRERYDAGGERWPN